MMFEHKYVNITYEIFRRLVRSIQGWLDKMQNRLKQVNWD